MKEVFEYFESIDLAYQLSDSVPFNTYYDFSLEKVSIYRRVRVSGKGKDAIVRNRIFCIIDETKEQKIRVRYQCHENDRLMVHYLKSHLDKNCSDFDFEETGAFELQFDSIEDFIEFFNKNFWQPIDYQYQSVVNEFGKPKYIKGGRM